MTKTQSQDQIEAIERLREILKPGDIVYCVLRRRAASGMSRVIDLFTIRAFEGDTRPTVWSLGFLTARALVLPADHKLGGVRVRGCGMDMGFHLVYCLGRALWPTGTPGDDKEPGKSDGGYALTHSWL